VPEAILTTLFIILLLVIVHGIFAGAEIAIITMRKTRLRELVEEGSARARAVSDLRAHPERFLATVQVGVTVLSEGAAALGGAAVAPKLQAVLETVPVLRPHAENLALTLVVAVVAYLSLVLGELVPKSLALRSAETYALLIATPMRFISWATRPLAWFLTASSNLVLRPFGDRTTFMEARVSAEELQQLVDEATKTGAIDSHSGEIASRALGFSDLTADAVMVPRNRVTAIDKDASEVDIRQLMLDSPATRWPVCEESLDKVLGYITARDVLARILAGLPLEVGALKRPAHFVPWNMRAADVLRDMQHHQIQLAVVVDEHGGTEGLLTLEDLVEELVGDILGEHEAREEHIHHEAQGLVLVRGATPIRDVNRALRLDLPEGEDWTTLGGLCTSLAGGIPHKGDRLLTEDGVIFEIVSATPRAVGMVRIVLPEVEADGAGI